MSSSKKEIIIGAVIVMVFSLWLINVGMNASESGSSPWLSLSAPQNNFVSWLITFFALLGLGSGLWIISQSDKPGIKKWIERYTVRAAIPGYFIYVFVPLIMGLVLILVLGQSTWGIGLACVSVPAALVFLIYGLRKNGPS